MDEKNNFCFFAEEQGSVHISEGVIGSVAAKACLDTQGVHSMAASPAANGRKVTAKGVLLRHAEDGSCQIDVYFLVRTGTPVTDIGKTVQKAVKTAVESVTGIGVSLVNAYVAGIFLQK